MTKDYQKDTRWSAVLEVLHRDAESKDPRKTRLPYELIDGLPRRQRYIQALHTVVREIFELVHDKSGRQGYDRLRPLVYFLVWTVSHRSSWTRHQRSAFFSTVRFRHTAWVAISVL
jgi:hypothetical protein